MTSATYPRIVNVARRFASVRGLDKDRIVVFARGDGDVDEGVGVWDRANRRELLNVFRTYLHAELSPEFTVGFVYEVRVDAHAHGGRPRTRFEFSVQKPSLA